LTSQMTGFFFALKPVVSKGFTILLNSLSAFKITKKKLIFCSVSLF
jgi:hypothetical protein